MTIFPDINPSPTPPPQKKKKKRKKKKISTKKLIIESNKSSKELHTHNISKLTLFQKLIIKSKYCTYLKSVPKQALIFTCLQHKSFENPVGKGEIARNEHFLLSPHCFLFLCRPFCLLYKN